MKKSDKNAFIDAVFITFVRILRMYRMKRNYFAIVLMVIATLWCSCDDVETYAEMKEKERTNIDKFIKKQGIKVITEKQFEEKGYVTDTARERNEFVLFKSSGVYMQIVREGNGKRIEPGESRRLACRFWEYNMMGDSLQLTNRVMKFAVSPEILNVSNNSGYINGSFDLTVATGSLVYKAYGDTQIPDGWLKALGYLRVGAQTTDENRIAKVRLIVPHSSGHSHATASVYPCFYELTFQEL